MKHTGVLKQSWHILRTYRLLWIFGFIVALTTLTMVEFQWTADEGTIIRADENSIFARFCGDDRHGPRRRHHGAAQ